MDDRYDIVALGELLIDFTENGISAQGNPIMEANPGGAPCNVLAMMNKLGHRAAFIGKVGNDMFGKQLKAALCEAGICTDGLALDDKINTTLAFVHTLEDGDREFSFYRNPGADMMLCAADLNEKLLKNTAIFHFGTLSMTHEGCRLATKRAIEIAKENGAIVSFDPNIREPLWDDLEVMREQIEYGLSKCDILKISDNEIVFLTGEEDFEKGVEWIRERYDISLILVSLGKDGSLAYSKSSHARADAFLQAKTIETTGAGDTFMASALHYVAENGLKDYSADELGELLVFANAAASIITTKRGALRVMPGVEEIEGLMSEYR